MPCCSFSLRISWTILGSAALVILLTLRPYCAPISTRAVSLVLLLTSGSPHILHGIFVIRGFVYQWTGIYDQLLPETLYLSGRHIHRLQRTAIYAVALATAQYDVRSEYARTLPLALLMSGSPCVTHPQ